MLSLRTISLALRALQFLSAVVVLGLSANLLNERYYFQQSDDNSGVLLLVPASTISAFSLVLAVVWMIPTTPSISNFLTDLVFAVLWLVVFGLLVSIDVFHVMCDHIMEYPRVYCCGLAECQEWVGTQAVSFLAAFFWFASSLFGAQVYYRKIKAPVDGTIDATTAASAMAAPPGRKRRFHHSRLFLEKRLKKFL